MSQDTNTEPRKRGRPPSEAAQKRALQAAHDILMAEGFGRLTIEAVAARSGVGKPTIYRSWANAQGAGDGGIAGQSAAASRGDGGNG